MTRDESEDNDEQSPDSRPNNMSFDFTSEQQNQSSLSRQDNSAGYY